MKHFFLINNEVYAFVQLYPKKKHSHYDDDGHYDDDSSSDSSSTDSEEDHPPTYLTPHTFGHTHPLPSFPFGYKIYAIMF